MLNFTAPDILIAWAGILTALGTTVMAFFTVRLASATKKLVEESHQASALQLAHEKTKMQLELLLRYNDQFDGPRIRRARYLYAGKLLKKLELRVSPDDLLNFLDGIGTSLRRGHIEAEATWDYFSSYGRYWWYASQEYIILSQKEDPEFFTDFGFLISVIERIEKTRSVRMVKPSEADIEEFLRDEFETYHDGEVSGEPE